MMEMVRRSRRPLALMGTVQRRPRSPSQGHELPGGSLRSDRLPQRGGCGNLGEVKAASSRLRLRPRPPGHRGIGSSSERGARMRLSCSPCEGAIRTPVRTEGGEGAS